VWASLPPARVGFLWINEPDARADAAPAAHAGGRLSPRAFGLEARFAAVRAAAGRPPWPCGGVIGAPLAVRAARRLARFPETPAEQIPAQAATLGAFVLMAVGIGLGFVVATIV
jgi:hypothetical protein